VPIVGMEPAVKPAAERTRRRRVGVIATEATIQAEVFARLVERFANGVEVWTRACPGLVEAVEEGRLEDAHTLALLREYLSPMLQAGIDELVLGCTHYPFLMPALRQVVGPGVDIIDPAPAVARQVGRVLDMHGLRADSLSMGKTRAYCTGDVRRFRQTAERLVGPIGEVRQVLWQAGRLRLVPAG
ncbi:MAG: glutamate racemase, partial [Anaerolineae bacterium]